MIENFLKYIKLQTGLNLLPCDYFTGIRFHKGEKYFNILLKERISESQEFLTLEKFCNTYKTFRMEPNGLNRIAIFPLQDSF